MEIAYTFTDRDVTLFFREYSLYRRQVKRRWGRRSRPWVVLYYLLLLIVPVAVFVVVASLHAGFDIATVAAVSTGFAWRWPLSLLWSDWQRKRLRQSPHFLGPHVVCTSPGGFSDRRKDGQWTAYWASIVEVSATKNFLLFFHESEAVTPVPRHAFGSSGEADMFHQKSLAYWQQGVWLPEPRAGGPPEFGSKPEAEREKGRLP